MKFGIVGTGGMAATMARTIEATNGLTISAVRSNDAGRAGQFASTHAKGAVATEDWSAFFASCDAVYIASSPEQHVHAVREAISAGKPVLCEKPMTTSEADTKEMFALAKEAGTLLVEAHWTVHLPAYRALKDKLAVGDLGQARRLAFDFSYPVDDSMSKALFSPQTGGVLLDRAVYGVVMALDLLGPVKDQVAHLDRDDAGLDRSALLMLTHQSGARSSISVSFDVQGQNTLSIACQNGHALLGPPSLAFEALQIDWHHGAGSGAAAMDGLKDKIKQSGIVRKLSRIAKVTRAETHSFAAYPYQPMLMAFVEAAQAGQLELRPVTPAISIDVARIIAFGRAA